MLKNPAETKQAKGPTELGGALRRRRKELGLTMQQVADHAGLSVGFISQVERGLTAPSLSSLVSLSEALDTHISRFLDQPDGSERVTRQTSRTAYSIEGPEEESAARYERVSSHFDGSQLHSVVVHEPPGHRSEPISHRGEEMFFILAGELTVEIEGKAYLLRVGDSIHFDSRRVHSSWNHTSGVTTMLWCGTMDIFGEAPDPIHKTGPGERVDTSQNQRETS